MGKTFVYATLFYIVLKVCLCQISTKTISQRNPMKFVFGAWLLSRNSISSAAEISRGAPLQTCFFVPGFKVPRRCYERYERIIRENFNNLSFHFFEDSQSGSGGTDIVQSVDCLLSYIRKSNSKDIVLIGHSRGGAVASAAAAKLSGCKALILLDPVDDSTLTAINILSSTSIFCPTLIFSTPFGGRSKYYKTEYSSACAPPERSSVPFFDALRFSSRVLLTIPDIGHLQLIDHTESFSFGNVCAVGPLELETRAKNFCDRAIIFWYVKISKVYFVSWLS